MRLAVSTGLAAVALVACAKAEPMDQNLTGELTSGDSRVPDDDSPYDEYVIRVESGWRINAEMSSDEFDTYLILIGPSGEAVAQHDDIDYDGGNLNSELEFTATQGGRYRLWANGARPTDVGHYTLHIRSGPP